MSRTSDFSPLRNSLLVFGVGFVALLASMQWTAQEEQAHIRAASQRLFPAALDSHNASDSFASMIQQYSDVVVMQNRPSLASADHNAGEAIEALERTRSELPTRGARQRQAAELLARVADLHRRSQVAYSQTVESRGILTEAMQATMARLAQEDREIQAGLLALQGGIADDFGAELAQIERWSKIQRIMGAALFVVVIAALGFSMRAVVQIAAQRHAAEALSKAHKETEVLLNSVPSMLIGLDGEGLIRRWNRAATAILGWDESSVYARPLRNCGVRWRTPEIDQILARRSNEVAFDASAGIKIEKDGNTRFLSLEVIRLTAESNSPLGSLVVGADITDRIVLENQLQQAQKLEAVGQLSAGIAHEINTPTQFVAGNAGFLKEAWGSVAQILMFLQAATTEAGSEASPPAWKAGFDELSERADLDYILKEVPKAIDQSLEGLARVTKIVRAMKEFSHPGSENKTPTDINRALETTITVANNEWKYVANVVTDFASDLPLAPCMPGELNQVILNLLVNAAHAIGDRPGRTAEQKGTILVATRCSRESVEISIHDDGSGIPENVRSRIFEPFFTTKPVGRGTGQGLALAYSTIVKKHQGKIWFETEIGKGTTFFVQLPLRAQAAAVAGA